MESDKTVETNMKATLSEQVKEVEQAMLDLLIARFFEDCNERRNLAGHNIFLDDTGYAAFRIFNKGCARSVPFLVT